MEIETRDFGKIDVNEDDIIKFPEGIPGFLEEKKFVLLPVAEDSPFVILQSITTANLAFITIEPVDIIADYEFEISDKVEKLLKIEQIEDLLIFNIATIRDSIKNMTVNLAAPVVINIKKRLGKQIILDDEKYPVRAKLFTEKEKVAE